MDEGAFELTKWDHINSVDVTPIEINKYFFDTAVTNVVENAWDTDADSLMDITVVSDWAIL
jgi:hypothetical protein